MDVVWEQRHLWLSRFYTKSGGSSRDLGQSTISGGERLPNMLLHLVDGCIFILKFLEINWPEFYKNFLEEREMLQR